MQGAARQQDAAGLLTTWYNRVRESQFPHYEPSRRWRRRYTLLGVLIVLLTVGTGAIALLLLNRDIGSGLRYTMGGLSGLAGLLATPRSFGATSKAPASRFP
jgi:hypothetical protein